MLNAFFCASSPFAAAFSASCCFSTISLCFSNNLIFLSASRFSSFRALINASCASLVSFSILTLASSIAFISPARSSARRAIVLSCSSLSFAAASSICASAILFTSAAIRSSAKRAISFSFSANAKVSFFKKAAASISRFFSFSWKASFSRSASSVAFSASSSFCRAAKVFMLASL